MGGVGGTLAVAALMWYLLGVCRWSSMALPGGFLPFASDHSLGAMAFLL